MTKIDIVVSIVTVCHNSEKTIRDTIDSVLNQTYPNLEYIIIDGKSTDSTVNIIQEYCQKFNDRDKGYRYVSESDEGIYDAMNKGIHMACGELVGIINSDDWYEPEAVECAVRHYIQQPYDLFYADLRIVGGKRCFVKRARNSSWVSSRYWNHPTTFIPKRLIISKKP
ncbi:MAG: glycosyltransferase [Lachnospiraceae bacterium]|jgi:glycosyltransferase involved in cell wall biosynthesis|nr:glycosyltransferase [Lachnospiraceae bacterium]